MKRQYPLYRLAYVLTKDRFNDLVKDFNPTILHSIPHNIKFKESIKKYKDRYLFIKEDWSRNEELNNITDYFTEQVRIQCYFKKNPSPLEYWNKHNKELLTKTTDVLQLRELMYSKVKFCNNFRVSVAITILKLFNAKKWLDISSGWGDRLVAAIACGLDVYCGVDPNEKLHPYYDEIINTLCPPDKHKNFTVLNDGFETAVIPYHEYDIVFSSPPFFDLEVYSQSPKDSLVSYPTSEKWYTDFLIVSLTKAYGHLSSGGHMVLYMGEGVGTNYITRMCHEMNKLMTFEGCIYYYYENAKIPRTFYVWKK